ncbi:MAG: pantoate--beta-alanine ligase, partial [Muribaculaceae bacterium]
LALSSRNVRLSPEARAIAPEINRALRASLDFARDHSVAETRDFVVGTINSKGMETEYYEIVDARTMQPVADWADTPCAVGCVTVYCGGVRLIDNIKYQ